jgi:hypothetical protein
MSAFLRINNAFFSALKHAYAKFYLAESDTTDKTGKRFNPQRMHKGALPNEAQMITKQPSLKFIKLIYNGNNKMQGNGKLQYRVSAQPERRFMACMYKSI